MVLYYYSGGAMSIASDLLRGNTETIILSFFLSFFLSLPKAIITATS
ncbi:hypothetical protein [Treponema pedis]|nr:hypothetical protein [Treponema pedis]